MSINFTVLLSVYHRENPSFLAQSLGSIFTQTVFPQEVVLVKDGPLNVELEEEISKAEKRYKELKVISLPHNVGLGRALNEGLKHCSYDLVARMDTDDIAKPGRFEKQLKIFEVHPEVDLVSAWIEEFEGTPEHLISTRKLPETPDELYEYGKKRSPVNHPVVMFRKEAVLRCGGYMHYPLFEDYYLWARMLVNGSRFYTIQESLLWFRTSSDLYNRRGGLKYALTEIRLQFLFVGLGYIGAGSFLRNIVIRFSTRIMPNNLRRLFYKIALR